MLWLVFFLIFNKKNFFLEKLEQDKKCDVELSKILFQRKVELEDKLILKLEQLKIVCIAEGVSPYLKVKYFKIIVQI